MMSAQVTNSMRFARVVFIVAGVWGLVVVTPLYFLLDISGRQYPPPADYPQFFYGFLTVTTAWQIAFLMIGADPGRFRPLMIASIIEKLGFVATALLLFWQERISTTDASVAVPDFLLGVLFVAAFARTRDADVLRSQSR
jgi:hypothetical protein